MIAAYAAWGHIQENDISVSLVVHNYLSLPHFRATHSPQKQK